jgi:glycerol-3-phosphate O-acyltransferase
MEIDSYVGELSGKPKEKETLLGFLRSLKRLRENFGNVHVNIGEPIALSPLLDEHQPEWRDSIGQEGRGATVSAAVDVLAQRIMRHINAAAAVTPVNLLALVMLATQRQGMPETLLRSQLALCLELLRGAPCSARVTVTPLDADGVIAAGFKAQVLQRNGAESISLAVRHAPAMAWYRNNVLHVFAMPSLLACCFQADAAVDPVVLQGQVLRLYPYLSAELFLPWEESALDAVVLQNLRLLRQRQLLRSDPGETQWQGPAPGSAQDLQLSLLAQPMQRTIERYYLAVTLLLRAGSGAITQAQLEKSCQAAAQSLVTPGLASPDFFDRSLFEGFVGLLRRRGVIRADAEGRLQFDDTLGRMAADAQRLLSGQLRHGILQAVQG